MLKPQRPQSHNFTMVTWWWPQAAATPLPRPFQRGACNQKSHPKLQSVNHNSLLKCNMARVKVAKMPMCRNPANHFQLVRQSFVDVAEKLQSIKIVVWAI
jgi:hypothetical protein